jgi:hypothetical protein
MSYYALYRSTADVVGHHDDRASAARQAVRIALAAPDLSLDVGIVEIDDEGGGPVGSFVAASDLLAAEDAAAMEVIAASKAGEDFPDVPELTVDLEARVAAGGGNPESTAARMAEAKEAVAGLEAVLNQLRVALVAGPESNRPSS